MIIETNTAGDGMAAFYCIEPKRASELIECFGDVTRKYAKKLHDEIESAHKNRDVAGICIEYYDIVSDFLSAAKTVNEAAYASYCASGACYALESYGNETNKEFAIMNTAKKAHTDE